MQVVVIRRARPEESDQVAALFRTSRDTELPYLPNLHTAEEDRAFFRDRVFPTCEVWVAERDGALVGFCAYRDGWLDHLYVHPDHLRRRIGTALLRKATDANAKLQLWTFQRNAGAIGFYESQGFTLLKLTDGRENEEREPDALYKFER
jgi:GNAT superfamily N-acetyltransferase